MNDTTVSRRSVEAAVDAGGNAHRSPQWLVMTHHLPPEPAYLRVKVRRRLARIGAVPLKNSVYVLPPNDDTREDFEWLCQEIRQAGGETSLSLSSFVDGQTDRRLIGAFRDDRAADRASAAPPA